VQAVERLEAAAQQAVEQEEVRSFFVFCCKTEGSSALPENCVVRWQLKMWQLYGCVSGDELSSALGVDVWCGITWEEWQVQAAERLEAAAQQAVEQEEVRRIRMMASLECYVLPVCGSWDLLHMYNHVPGDGVRQVVQG
jgi:hypothetical protein